MWTLKIRKLLEYGRDKTINKIPYTLMLTEHKLVQFWQKIGSIILFFGLREGTVTVKAARVLSNFRLGPLNFLGLQHHVEIRIRSFDQNSFWLSCNHIRACENPKNTRTLEECFQTSPIRENIIKIHPKQCSVLSLP